jgi:hypothetical protein
MVGSDRGLLLLREALVETGVIDDLTQALHDPRHPSYAGHTLEEILTQRITQICCDYKNAND